MLNYLLRLQSTLTRMPKSPPQPQPACQPAPAPTFPSTPIPVSTKSGKKIGLARAAADCDSGSTGASLPGTSSASHGPNHHFHDTLLFKPSSLSKRIGVFSAVVLRSQ